MTQGKVLYTDGHKVVVTDSTLEVAGNRYRLDGIIRFSCLTIPPNRLPIALGVTVAMVFMALGIFSLVPDQLIPQLHVGSFAFSARPLAIIFGGTLLIASLVFMFLDGEKYSVHIVTAEGEKKVLVSKQKEYIEMIGEALGKGLEKWKF
jgi:hypothetical protein